jgi:hypothetical protein
VSEIRHPEKRLCRDEGSAVREKQILRFAQNDTERLCRDEGSAVREKQILRFAQNDTERLCRDEGSLAEQFVEEARVGRSLAALGMT